jgi:DNA modification methylase
MQLICADCVEAMKGMADNSVDAIVTDPPYGLSFMGKKWDYDVPSVEVWQEALRVLKPGGYLLAFAGTRTQHRMACRIEDAGFEIRDMICWAYGSGFPKSLNIGKAVDELRGVEREFVQTNPNKRDEAVEQASQGKSQSGRTTHADITRGTSEWEGWGTNLKPAVETVTVARKPLSENTVAANCMKWGTGGINIDGCRIPHNEACKPIKAQIGGNKVYGQSGRYEDTTELKANGRFPANLIHDGSEEVLARFPNCKGAVSNGKKAGTGYDGGFNCMPQQRSYSDSGSAARFFYCAKASASERNEGVDGGNKHPTVKPVALMEYLVKLVSREGAVVLDPFCGSGTTGVACVNLGRNFIGIERDPAYFELMKTRIETRQTQTRLL